MSFIICPISDLWPAGTQARNKLPKAVLNRLENMAPHSNLDHIQNTIPPLIADSSFEVCISRGLTFFGPLGIGVPGTSQLYQGYSMRHRLCLPYTDQSRMTRSGLCACTMTSAGIDLPPGTCSPSKSQYSSTVLLPTKADFRQCDLGRNRASRSTFSGPMCVYNGREHGTASASPCSHRAGN
jgi:hypothetical protein